MSRAVDTRFWAEVDGKFGDVVVDEQTGERAQFLSRDAAVARADGMNATGKDASLAWIPPELTEVERAKVAVFGLDRPDDEEVSEW